MTLTVDASGIKHAVRELGLARLPLCVHSSLRSFGKVEGGADTIVDGFLAEGCTVVVPTFSGIFSIPPPRALRLRRNGIDYKYPLPGLVPHARIFTPDSNEFDRDEMGAIPGAVLGRPGRVRGDHPRSSFAAVGPSAAELMRRQRPLDVYAPLEDLCSQGGYVVLMGVGLDRMTLIHLAEKRAGRNLFRRWANDRRGKPMIVEAGACSAGFPKLDPSLSPFERRHPVGASTWRVYSAADALAAATEAINRNPRITHCERSCIRCDDAVAGGPIL